MGTVSGANGTSPVAVAAGAARIGGRDTSHAAAMAGLTREASMQLVAGHGRAAIYMVGSSTSPAHSGRCLCGREFARIQEINVTNSSKQ